jgi:ATP-binding cassette subfamily B protein
MINKYFKKRFALSTKGAKDFTKGVFFTVLLDIALMSPAVVVFLFLNDRMQTHGFVYYTLVGLAFMLAMFAVAVLQYRSTYTAVYDESANRRISLAEKLRKLPLAFFGEKNLSDLTATIMDDCADLEHTFSHSVPQLFASLITIALIATGLFFYNWQLALALLWVVPLALTIILTARNKTYRDFHETYVDKRNVTEHIQETLDTIQEIKSYNREDGCLSALDEKLTRYEKTQTKGELLTGMFLNGAQSLLKLGLASVILVGATLLSRGTIDMFTYLMFLFVGSRIYGPIQETLSNLATLVYLDIRLNRMKEMEALPVQQGKTDFNPQNYDIEFNNVDFAYESGRQILKGVSFNAKQGEITALVGSSGSGKSTAAKLAARFWDIQSGQIRLGGEDISTIDPETLLKNYSVVFQDVVLFNASVMDNIRVGKRDASDDEVLHVARLAQCDEFVSKLPHGYQTVVGENGETLSGGERQRLSIARALLKNAPVVLLDEATASLDVENETKIQAGISELVKNKTVLIIAHRMRTIANADKIVVLDGGVVVESGSPDQLLRQNGMFAKFYGRGTTVKV